MYPGFGNLSLKVVSLNGGPMGAATTINDGTYINLLPTTGNLEFILPNGHSNDISKYYFF